ncbi:MAG: hypothetical protein ACOVNR_00175 [Chitinophagaceae bacterium]
MKIVSNKPENTAWLYIMAMLLILLIFSCGTKTKTSTDNETKEKAIVVNDSVRLSKKLDSIKVALEEEFRKKYSDSNSQTSKKEATRTTTTEVSEIVHPTAGFREIPGTDLFLNDQNGKILERKTKTIIEERFNEEMYKQQLIKFEYEEKRKKDSIATIKAIDSIVALHLTQYEKKDLARSKNKEVKGWRPSLLFIIGAALFLIALAFSLLSWFKHSNPLFWLFSIFKRKKNTNDGSAA